MTTNETVFNVAGMTCQSCVRHVSEALASVPGVASVQVQLKAGTALVQHNPTASTSDMLEALRDAGYDVEVQAVSKAGPRH